MTGKYIGLITKYAEAEGAGVLRAAYPEGHVAIINNRGELGAYVTGRNDGMRIDGYEVFGTAEEAFKWVTQKGD
jgi:hypothetical protein